jgi:hypothetical protein
LNPRQLLRTLAIAIAVLAALDPAVTTQRYTNPIIAVVAGPGAHDSALGHSVARGLRHQFEVVRVPFGGASATVIVGNHLPQGASGFGVPSFAVLPSTRGLAITGLSAPSQMQLEARAAVNIALRVQDHEGERVAVTMLADGVPVDRAELVVQSQDHTLSTPL